MNANDLDDELEDLVSAEDFLDYFDVPYDPSVVHVNRLHILQRFHDYLARDGVQDAQTLDAQTRHALYRDRLAHAYQDFVQSDALTEKVFKVFHMHEPRTTFVPLDQAFVKRD